MKNLVLDRPLIFFDLETTGVYPNKDRIIEISVIKILPSGEQEKPKTRRINPEMHIPEESTAIHGIVDDDVKDAPTFKDISKKLYIYLEGCDLGGYNICNFDVPMLVNEFARAGLSFSVEGRRLMDPYVIFCKQEPRSLEGALKFYCGKKLEGAHGAEADTQASYDVFKAQLEKYNDLPSDIDELHKFCDRKEPDWIDSNGRFKWKNGVAIVGFGQNQGMQLEKIVVDNPGFLKWILNKDFQDDVKEIAANALKGVFPVKESDE